MGSAEGLRPWFWEMASLGVLCEAPQGELGPSRYGLTLTGFQQSNAHHLADDKGQRIKHWRASGFNLGPQGSMRHALSQPSPALPPGSSLWRVTTTAWSPLQTHTRGDCAQKAHTKRPHL